MSVKGFDHGNRGVGIRDLQLVIPSVVCSTHVAKKISSAVGAVTFEHNTGCGIIGGDVSGIAQFFGEMANHPNINSVLIVGLGCETIQGNELADSLLAKNKSTKYLVIQESGGMGQTLSTGSNIASELASANKGKSAELTQVKIGIDNPAKSESGAKIASMLEKKGYAIEIENGANSGENFTNLMRKCVHLIISIVAPDQPVNGYPFIPVINLASNSPLHQAISLDFDLSAEASDSQILDLILKVINGEKSKAELLNIGEIVAPRLVRSV